MYFEEYTDLNALQAVCWQAASCFIVHGLTKAHAPPPCLDHTHPHTQIMFVLGTLITVGGIAILLSRSGSDEDEKDVCKCCSDIPCCYIGGWNALRADSVCSGNNLPP